jgi:hypothetical protein
MYKLKIVVGKPEGETPFRTPSRWQKDSIPSIYQTKAFKGVEW